MKKTYIIIIFALLFSATIFWFFQQNDKSIVEQEKESDSAVEINGIFIPVELADTEAERRWGLSRRAELPAGSGMLFVFPEKQIRSFWMKDMNFALDIVWIDGNRIVGISKNLLPEGEFPENTYDSDAPVDYVLELNAGFCEKNNIKAGDEIKYLL